MELLKKILLFLGSLIIARWFYKCRTENIINLNEEKIFKSSPIGAVSEYKGILQTFYSWRFNFNYSIFKVKLVLIRNKLGFWRIILIPLWKLLSKLLYWCLQAIQASTWNLSTGEFGQKWTRYFITNDEYDSGLSRKYSRPLWCQFTWID